MEEMLGFNGWTDLSSGHGGWLVRMLWLKSVIDELKGRILNY